MADRFLDLIPVVPYEDIRAGHDFLVEVLGFESAGIVVHVADVDAHFARVKAAGADITREPTDEDCGQREYGVRDPEGHSWYIATPIP